MAKQAVVPEQGCHDAVFCSESAPNSVRTVAPGLPLLRRMRRTVTHLDPGIGVSVCASMESAEGGVAVVVPASGADLEAVERALIEFALQQTAGNRTRAARFLRLSRSALLYRMQKYGVCVPAQPLHAR